MAAQTEPPGPGRSSIRLGLDTVGAVCERLGRPQLATPTVLISGTNGKGSTAVMLAGIAGAGGLRVGLFHSPSLGAEHEQVCLDGSPLGLNRFAALKTEVLEVGERVVPGGLSGFEALTAAAFLAFARQGLDLAVVETGLGGARDATNIAQPIASILVSVDLDHREFLGPSLAAIARDKAGIFRPGRPAILGWLRPSAMRVARQVATASGARVIQATATVKKLEPAGSADTDGFRLVTGHDSYLLRPGLEGAHQRRNAALAVLAAEALQSRFPGFVRDAIERGVAACRFPGRLEWLEVETCRGEARRVLLDAAHNPAAAEALAGYLSGLGEPCNLLFGAFADKDAARMLDILRPWVARVWLTPLEHDRSWDPRAFARACHAELVESPAAGLRLSLQASTAPLLVTGSLHLIGQVRPLCVPPPDAV